MLGVCVTLEYLNTDGLKSVLLANGSDKTVRVVILVRYGFWEGFHF